ncbi:nitric oxide synthase [Virgibacillus halodenitrificans]|uniref:nitric oxide synthase oxygenase n=1 Tax=Virgibacillus halodenitrificans TaxID=1482 RepID=UPI0013694FF9|nr:nitric oxide synthase oxygenase [Virgibacillus halodenitrificans]MYL45574.1 nitric oxide synthase [Virgibacillus halodenitrificans]
MNNQTLIQEAELFIQQAYTELGKSMEEIESRLKSVRHSIELTNFYEHTLEELSYGAKVAWRNSNRCIGRFFWENLNVVDARGMHTSKEVFGCLLNHIDKATNEGKIQPLITIFQPQKNGHSPIKIWNHQLVRYAGYKTEDGIIGDPDSLQFTEKCMELGWQGEGTMFDVLPLVIQIDNGKPEYMEIPKELIMEVPIQHAEYDLFGGEEIKWYAVPIISDMRLEIGGIHYTAAPFNGWYMGTEIGARNLADTERYNLLPTIAKQMELDMKRLGTLWKDRALVELNSAVLDSFKKRGVTIVDHHTAANQFRLFEQKEEKCQRQVTGKWSWLIPPMSPATTHVFHRPFNNTVKKPNYFYQDKYYTD